jgi:hypothetical protein
VAYGHAPFLVFFFHYLNEPWARIPRGSFDAGRDWHSPRWFCTVIEVVFVDRGGFAARGEFACKTEVVLHADRGGSGFACIPRPYGLYRSEADFGNCAKKGILSPVLKYIEFILKSLSFSQGFQIQLQFLHSGIQTEKCSQNLSDTQKGIHVHT